MSQSTDTTPSTRSSVANIVGVVADGQTYKNLLYLLLAFPLGIAYYIILMVGFTVGLGLSVLVVGLGILLATVIGLRYLASFERGLANTLLGTTIRKPDDIEKASEGIVGTAKAYLQASSTWRGLGFIVLKFPIGVLSFVLLVTFLGTAVELLLIPLFPGGVFNVQIAGWVVAESVETTTQQAIAVPVGAVLVLLAVHILNAFARANASIASSLLGPN
ncbi:sensor domain-containing protein [Halobacteriaceae bacterium SHR40]|uniref:sensor domain-containing protein n=1 Tax=Halovenus amylolytica TaxID=2500550 RepID=UPI000FE2F8BF